MTVRLYNESNAVKVEDVFEDKSLMEQMELYSSLSPNGFMSPDYQGSKKRIFNHRLDNLKADQYFNGEPILKASSFNFNKNPIELSEINSRSNLDFDNSMQDNG